MRRIHPKETLKIIKDIAKDKNVKQLPRRVYNVITKPETKD